MSKDTHGGVKRFLGIVNLYLLGGSDEAFKSYFSIF
jgi:hypothetical protein